MKYATNYKWLCGVCNTTIASVAAFCYELADEYASDYEGPIMFAGDNSLLCGGRVCKNKPLQVGDCFMVGNVEFEVIMIELKDERYYLSQYYPLPAPREEWPRFWVSAEKIKGYKRLER